MRFPVTSYRRIKSLFGIVFSSLSEIFAVFGVKFIWSMSCEVERISSTGTPAFRLTSIEMSCQPFGGDRRRDLCGILNAARNIPRRDRHREDKFVRAVLVLERLDIADLDDHVFAGHDVRDRLGEDFVAFLIEQCGGFAFGLCGFVRLAALRDALSCLELHASPTVIVIVSTAPFCESGKT